MEDKQLKEKLLKSLKDAGKSNPAGIHWDKLRKILRANLKLPEQYKLKNPLILGGAIASDAHKHERLEHHLDWAIDHECFDVAIKYLSNLPDSAWNVSTPENWHKEFTYDDE